MDLGFLFFKEETVKNSRRDFLKFTTGFVAAQALLSADSTEASRTAISQIPILQGGTSESATTLVVVLPTNSFSRKQIQFEIFNSQGALHRAWEIFDATILIDQAKLFHLDVYRLEKDLFYKLVIYIEGQPVDQRIFQAFASRSNNVILGSCSNENIREGKTEIWKKMEATRSDAFFYLGDAVYADSALESAFGTPASLESAHRKYLSTLKSIPHYFRQRLLPQFNIWDDHDFGWNDGDETHPNKPDMLIMFRAFFPQKFGPRLEKGPHLSFSIQVNGIQYLFVDGRSERNYSSKQNRYISKGTKDWILNRISRHEGPSAIITGSQLCGFGTNRDSIEQAHPEDFGWFKRLFESQSSVVFFISGDTHYSHLQILNWGSHQTVELTSSGLHSYNFTSSGKRDFSQGQMGYYKGINFCTLSAQAKGLRAEGLFSCISLRGVEFDIPLNLY
jgi:hypothetical protein